MTSKHIPRRDPLYNNNQNSNHMYLYFKRPIYLPFYHSNNYGLSQCLYMFTKKGNEDSAIIIRNSDEVWNHVHWSEWHGLMKTSLTYINDMMTTYYWSGYHCRLASAGIPLFSGYIMKSTCRSCSHRAKNRTVLGILEYWWAWFKGISHRPPQQQEWNIYNVNCLYNMYPGGQLLTKITQMMTSTK